MSQRLLRLGTRRSALARAQSLQVARALQSIHPDVTVELVGIDTRGDRNTAVPLTQIEGKEFFTAEIDAALLARSVDFTVHSYKDLSLQRSPALYLAAVPAREIPHDIVWFAADVPARLAAAEELKIGSSSPRRAAFVPEFLQRALPGQNLARVRLCELRGNVDTRLRRLREPVGSERHLDGVILAAAGLSRLWRDADGQGLLRELLSGLPHMLLPLSLCPTAPAQGALAIECRDDDASTRALLHALDDPATRTAIDAERALLAARGGGCHQRFGATQITLPGLGTLLYMRDAEIPDRGPQLHWQSERPLGIASKPIVAWDGTRVKAAQVESLTDAVERSRAQLSQARALFVAHRRAVAELTADEINAVSHVWVSGVESWAALARRGIWVEGCADSLGVASASAVLQLPLLQLPPLSQWLVLTHQGAEAGWSTGEAIGTYRLGPADESERAAAAAATHVYWNSSAQFDHWHALMRADVQHACGPGKTYDHLRRMQVSNLRLFPSAALWREWMAA